jgi:peptide/nickel transport system substrate-binding protein
MDGLIAQKSTLSACKLTLVLLFLLSLLNACGSPNGPVIEKSTSSPLLGHYPGSSSFTLPPSHVPSGEFVLGSTTFPTTANPLFASSDADLALDNALWGQPVVYDASFHVLPDQLSEVPLPENGGVIDDGKTIIMHLRHDLRWSDGQPLVAADFQYWWQLNQDAMTGATIQTGYDQIASIETPDDFTVVLHMKHAFGPYLLYLPYAAPHHAWQQVQPIDLQNTPTIFSAPRVTSGPYQIQTLAANQSYTLVPNPYYHSTTFHGPFIARLIYQAYPTVAALVQAVQAGHVTVSQGYRDDDLPALIHLPSTVHLQAIASASYEHLDFNLSRPLLQDINLRRAIQLSIDICNITRIALHAADCTRRVTQVEPPPSLFYDDAIAPARYDPVAARLLLARAGWRLDAHGLLSRQGQPLLLHLVTTAQSPLRLLIAQEIQRFLRAVGIQVKIETYSLNSFFDIYTKSGILASGSYDMALFTYVNGPDPDDEYAVFHSSQIPDTAHPELSNYGRVHDAVIDQALTQGRNNVAFTDRLAAYHRFLARLAGQVYLIPLFSDTNCMTLDARVHNVVPNANPSANTWNIGDWWL